MGPQVGQVINEKYRLESLIGDGGMGSVFAARHELLGTTVALKFLHSTLARRESLVDRFLQEAKVSAQIDSPHVVRVSDVDRTSDGLAYMVMEYVEGQTLQELYEDLYKQGKQLGYGDAFAYFLQMLDGVGAAHRKGIVHRDLKPDNVILSQDDKGNVLVKILDFGIAKLKASGEMDRGLTRPGVVMGTPEYMAPEQAFSADKVDARADLFSLGVMFFEMLGGRRPVGGDNAHSLAAMYLKGEVSKLRDLKPTIAEELAEAIHKAMAPKPDERFATVEAFRRAIAPFTPEGLPSELAPSSGRASHEPEPSAESAARAVPKTIPPEETFADAKPTPPDSEATEAEALSEASAPPTSVDEGRPAGMSQLSKPGSEQTEDSIDSSAAEVAEDQSARAVAQSALPPTKPEAGIANAGADSPGSPQAGKTVVGEKFDPPAFNASAMTPPNVGPAPAIVPPAPGPGRPQRGASPKRGISFITIVIIALVVSALATGGVYLAHEASLVEDSEDGTNDPPIIQLDTEPTTVPSDPDPPPADLPTSPAIPPAPDSPPPTQPTRPPPASPPASPPTSPPASPPTSTPTIPPLVIPSTLPPGIPTAFPPSFPIPFPGRTKPKPTSQPPASPPPSPFPTLPRQPPRRSG